MPKIVRFHQTGGPENLKVEDATPQEPGSGEVRLRVEAMGLNRAEALFMRGQYMDRPTVPSRIGYEAAGMVEAVGTGVDAAWMGKAVATVPRFGMSRYGVIGEPAVVPVEALGEYPANLSPTQAAAIWMQYLTAYGAIINICKFQPSDFVLIPAASSSVGFAAIQIVKAEGAQAIAATRQAAKREELLALGADHVIVTESEDLPRRVQEITGGKGARVIFDPVAGPTVEKLAQSAAAGGTVILYGNLAMQPTPFPLLTALTKGISIRGYVLSEVTLFSEKLNPAKAYVYERLQDGRFVPKIAKSFPLAEVADAYRYLESNAQVGKVVVTV